MSFLQKETKKTKEIIMFHISRAIVFIACYAAALYINIYAGLIGMIVALVVVPHEVIRHRIIKPAAGDK